MKRSQYFFVKNSKGFSLIELMVVLVILGLLAAKIAPNFINRIDDSKIQKAKVDIVALETGLKLYRVDKPFRGCCGEWKRRRCESCSGWFQALWSGVC